ncbi:hypothetical protein ACED96_09260 [Clostridium thermobutyricum]
MCKIMSEIEESVAKDIIKNGGKLSKDKKDLIYTEYTECTNRIIQSMRILDKIAEDFNINENIINNKYLDILKQYEKDIELKKFLGNIIDKSVYMDLIEFETGFIAIERKTIKLLNGITILIEIEGGQARAIGFRKGKQLDKIYEHSLILNEAEKTLLIKKAIEEFKDL